MERIVCGGNVLAADPEKTARYYKKQSPCGCSGCRNFYFQIKEKYPQLAALLEQFGADVLKPDETPWFEAEDHIEYFPYYTAAGRIETKGGEQFEIGDLCVDFIRPGDPSGNIPNNQSGPYFIIGIYGIKLPWAPNESFPAKEGPVPTEKL